MPYFLVFYTVGRNGLNNSKCTKGRGLNLGTVNQLHFVAVKEKIYVTFIVYLKCQASIMSIIQYPVTLYKREIKAIKITFKVNN